MKAQTLRRLMNIWFPFKGAGIRVVAIDDNFKRSQVALKLRWYNRNYVGAHFGGSLYAMTDPFFMLMLMQNLGKRYLVWDYASNIRYMRPGKGTVTATFTLSDEEIEAVKYAAESGEKTLPTFTVNILDNDGQTVASVEKQIYVRLKKRYRPGGC